MIEPTAPDQNPNPPSPRKGYRYDASAVDHAAERIVTDVRGFEENWKDDPRNTAQAVLDVFIAAGVVVLAGDN